MLHVVENERDELNFGLLTFILSIAGLRLNGT
jgi:hypothetical protein